MKCKWKDCEKQARAKSPFCGDTCSKRWRRANEASQDAPGSTKPDGLVLNCPDKSSPDTVTRTRPPIPGDDGYVGVCKEVDGVWQVKPDPPAPVADLSDIDLQLRLKSYQGGSWVNSPEHKEVLRRRKAVEPASCGAWT